MKRVVTGTVLFAALLATLFLTTAADEANDLNADDPSPITVNSFVKMLNETGIDKSPFEGPDNVLDPNKTRQGGDDIGSAFEITSLPFIDNGTTTGYTNDYDEVCPYSGSTSPDVVYVLSPDTDVEVRIYLCNSSYDTKVYVYENLHTPGSPIACNDDDCGASGYQSNLEGMQFSAGETYYIVVDGYGGDHGNYEIWVIGSDCTGEWQWSNADCISDYFEGNEIYAVYQDPIETGCAETYPFGINELHFAVHNPEDTAIVLTDLLIQMYDVDRSDPGCPKPGGLLGNFGPISRSIDPNSDGDLGGWWSTPFCVSGPYFIAMSCQSSVSVGTVCLWADDPSPERGRYCASYNKRGSTWIDLVDDNGWDGNLRLWSEGLSVEASDNCVCDPGLYYPGFPSPNDPSAPNGSWILANTTAELDLSTVNSSTFKIDTRSGFVPEVVLSMGSDGDGSWINYELYPPNVWMAGDLVTITISDRIRCADGGFYKNGYSRQFTVETDPSSSGMFVSQSDVPVGDGPECLIAADFDDDGNLDLAAANSGSNSVSVFLGNGDGSFSPQPDVAVDSFPTAVCAADFDNDGNTDLATANGESDIVTISLGNGDGSFSPRGAIATGDYPISISAADFNNDGRVDLATANNQDWNVSIILGNGDGSFSPHLEVETARRTYDVVAADFSNDGIIDLVIAYYGGRYAYFEVRSGNGDGSFGPPHRSDPAPSVAVDGYHYDRSIITADFNNDGNLDLAIAISGSDVVSYLFGSGHPMFFLEPDMAVGSTPRSICAADFNGDGNLDIATANSASDDISILYGDGADSFSPQSNVAVGSSPVSIVAADFNGDGRIDLATANHDADSISVLLNQRCCLEVALPFGRGNVDSDAGDIIDISDLVYLVDYMFTGGPAPTCWQEANVDGVGADDAIDISDLVYLVDYMFNGGPPPPSCP